MKREQSRSGAAEASVTIYLMLVLVLIAVLVCTVYESGRVSAMRARLKGVTYMGMDAVFSEYAAPVFEEYGVMMLWCKEEELIRRFEDYAEHNLDTSVTGLPSAAGLLHAQLASCELIEAVNATDENGRLFEEQVYDYMKYYLAERAAEKILSEAGIFDQGKKLEQFSERINKHKDVFLEVDRSVAKIKEKTDKVRSLGADPYHSIEKITDSLEKYERTEDDAFLNGVYIGQNDLIDVRYRLGDGLTDIQKETERYHTNAQKAADALKEIEGSLAVDREGMPEEVYQALTEEITELKQKAGEAEADLYKIEDNIGLIENCKKKVDTLDGLIETLDADIGPDNVNDIRNIAGDYLESFRDFDLSELVVNYDTERTEKESAAFLSSIGDIFEKGVLDYVAPEISGKKADLSEVPSALLKGGTQEESLAEAGVKKAAFAVYIDNHFGCYTAPAEEMALEYETEYILGGKASDRKNLQYVTDRIILIRTGCNLLSLFKDREKKMEANVLAAAIIGFTGMPVLIKIMQLLILSAWALAEAIVDVKILLKGEKVPTIKKSQEWNLSLTAIRNFSPGETEGTGGERGLSYTDYLRALLLMENRPRQVMNTLDMIQLNMVKNENSAFRAADCIMQAEVEASYSAVPLFVRIPFVAGHVGPVYGDYSFEMIQEYAY